MYRINGTEVQTSRCVTAIVIPDGTLTMLQSNEVVYIQQILGGMFTVQTSDGQLLRIDGKDADALSQPIPNERKNITLEEVNEKGLEAIVLEQLKTCYDPEIPVNIVDLGLVYEYSIKPCPDSLEFLVYIQMTLTAPGCGMGEILKSDVEKKIKDIPTIKEVMVDVIFDPPWESSLMSDAARLVLGL